MKEAFEGELIPLMKIYREKAEKEVLSQFRKLETGLREFGEEYFFLAENYEALRRLLLGSHLPFRNERNFFHWVPSEEAVLFESADFIHQVVGAVRDRKFYVNWITKEAYSGAIPVVAIFSIENSNSFFWRPALVDFTTLRKAVLIAGGGKSTRGEELQTLFGQVLEDLDSLRSSHV